MFRPLGDAILVSLNSLFEIRHHTDVVLAGEILHDRDPSDRPV
jgi:hypothetical protein